MDAEPTEIVADFIVNKLAFQSLAKINFQLSLGILTEMVPNRSLVRGTSQTQEWLLKTLAFSKGHSCFFRK